MGKFFKKYFEAPGDPVVLDDVAEIQKVAKKNFFGPQNSVLCSRVHQWHHEATQSPAEPWEIFLKNILKHQATQWYWMVLLRSKKLQKNFFWTSKQRFMRFMRFMRHCAYSIQWCAQTNSQITTPSSISDTCQEAAHKVNTVPLDVHN